jgi:hypothetical protein
MRALLVTSLLAARIAVAAETVAVLPATGTNVHDGYLAAAGDWLRADLERTGRFVAVAAPSPAAPGQEATPVQAAEAARAAGATLAVQLRVTRLGTNGLVRLAAYRPDGTLAHSDQMSVAGPDDLEPALRRLADGLATGRPASELAQIDTVTGRESEAYLRQEINRSFGVRLGTALILDRVDPVKDTGNASGVGVFWLYDARSWLADLSFDILGSSGNRLVALGLGAYYPFQRGNVTPYVGGGGAYAWVSHGGDGASGLQLRAGGGLLVGRLSTLQFRVDAQGFVNTFEERNLITGQSRAARGLIVTGGLGF